MLLLIALSVVVYFSCVLFFILNKFISFSIALNKLILAFLQILFTNTYYLLNLCFMNYANREEITRLVLKPGPGTWTRTLKNLDPWKPGPRKTWTQKKPGP